MGPVKAEGQLHRPFESRTPPFKHRVAAEDDIKGHQYSFHLLINLLTVYTIKKRIPQRTFVTMTTSAAFTFHLMTYVLHMLVQSRLKDNYIVHSTAKLLHSNIELELRKILITTINQKRKNVVVLCKTHFISTFIHLLCNKITDTTEEFGSYFQPDFLSKTRERTKIQYTRMHSSRMRTGRSLTVCHSLLLGGGRGSGSDPPKFPPWVWAWI